MLVPSVGAILLVAVLGPAHAQSDFKIGFVNMQFVIQNAPQTQAANKKLQEEFAPRQAALKSMQEDLQEKLDTYNRDSSVMGEAERTQLERELQQGDRDLKRRQDELQEDLNFRQNEILNQLQATLIGRVQSYVESEGYDVVLTSVVYVDEALDITQEVLQALSDEAGSE
jgi:outer membrane protein